MYLRTAPECAGIYEKLTHSRHKEETEFLGRDSLWSQDLMVYMNPQLGCSRSAPWKSPQCYFTFLLPLYWPPRSPWLLTDIPLHPPHHMQWSHTRDRTARNLSQATPAHPGGDRELGPDG